MTVFRDGVSGLPRDDRPVIVTVGTFDGVHLGHWSVLEEIGARAAAREGRSVLVTFDPHPLRIVRPEAAPKLLTTLDEKKVVLAGSRLDYVVFLAFTPELREYSPRRFVTEILLARLGMSELVIGYDHGFGRGRSGDVNTLRDIGAECGFAVDVVEAVHSGPGAISSSSIRRALAEGRVADANRGLGGPTCSPVPWFPATAAAGSWGFPPPTCASAMRTSSSRPRVSTRAGRRCPRAGSWGRCTSGHAPPFPGRVPPWRSSSLTSMANCTGRKSGWS